MRLGTIYDKNETRQQHDRLYRYGPYKKQNRVVIIDWIRCGLWQKPNRDNDVTDSTSIFYIKNQIEL